MGYVKSPFHVIANTINATVLLVGEDWTEELPIVAWKIGFHDDGDTFTTPILVGDEIDEHSSDREWAVRYASGVVDDLIAQRWETTEAAITDMRARIAKYKTRAGKEKA